MMDWNDGWSAADWFGMALVMLVFWSVIVGVAVMAFRSLQHRDSDATRANPERLLDERLARGEITEDEYLRKRDLLRAR
ncbi:MAG: SHOCT domain-containing protein [Nocardioidaceae bacterium]